MLRIEVTLVVLSLASSLASRAGLARRLPGWLVLHSDATLALALFLGAVCLHHNAVLIYSGPSPVLHGVLVVNGGAAGMRATALSARCVGDLARTKA